MFINREFHANSLVSAHIRPRPSANAIFTWRPTFKPDKPDVYCLSCDEANFGTVTLNCSRRNSGEDSDLLCRPFLVFSGQLVRKLL
ncbi:hypothetical protein OKW32_000064 [Paraburkholderia youngii]